MKLYVICKMLNGEPVVPAGSFYGYSFVDKVNSWGGYLFTGTAAQLAALATAANVYAFQDLEVPVAPEHQAAINAWLVAQWGPGSEMPPGCTYHEGIILLGQALNRDFQLPMLDVADPETTA